jgi:hypothetical protein
MAGTPDDTEDGIAAAEAAHLFARTTERLDLSAGRPAPAGARETVRLPSQRGGGVARPRSRRAPLPVAAAVAALGAALISYAPVAAVLALVGMLGAGGGSVLATARLALAGWLLAHGVPLDTAAGPLALVPLALAAFAAWRVARAGVHVTRAIGARRTGSVRRALAVGVTVGLAYGAIGALAALLAAAPGLTVSPLRAGLGLAGFGAIAAGFGALRTTGALMVLGIRTPPVLRDGLRTGLVAALLVLGAGAVLTGVALALQGGAASDMLAAYRTGVAGQAGIALICAMYAPNLAVWAASYLVGPGFALGVGTAVRATEVTVGALPAVPLFAALPDRPLTGTGGLLLGIPLLAGAVAGWLLTRRRRRAAESRPGPVAAPRWGTLLGAAVVAGPVAGALLGLAALASSGTLGAGRLATIGPAAWSVAGVAAGVLALGTVIGATATQALTTRRP